MEIETSKFRVFFKGPKGALRQRTFDPEIEDWVDKEPEDDEEEGDEGGDEESDAVSDEDYEENKINGAITTCSTSDKVISVFYESSNRILQYSVKEQRILALGIPTSQGEGVLPELVRVSELEYVS
jgi:hypothetical protein